MTSAFLLDRFGLYSRSRRIKLFKMPAGGPAYFSSCWRVEEFAGFWACDRSLVLVTSVLDLRLSGGSEAGAVTSQMISFRYLSSDRYPKESIVDWWDLTLGCARGRGGIFLKRSVLGVSFS